METVSRNLGRCLTERKLKDFDTISKGYNRFIRISQFDKKPGNVNELPDANLRITDVSYIHIGYVTYGINEDGSLTWLGEIIDSSD